MLKVLSLFSGIGAFEKALENIDEPFELINYCEIDKYASKAFSLIHGINEGLNLGDIKAIDTRNLPNSIDVITYGFPCQDISNAGKQKGFTDNNGEITRSGLFYEALRIIEDTQPKFAIAENVKALTSKKFTMEFKIVLDSLKDAGYTNYWAVLNAKDYGIPQNRERVFIISVRNDINHGFNFPKSYELKLRLKDLLETNVEEKYFLPAKIVEQIIFMPNKKNGDIKQIENCKPTKTRNNPNQGRIYGPDGIAPTLNCKSGGNLEPFIPVKNATKKGYMKVHDGDFINLKYPNSKTRRGRVGNRISQTLMCTDANSVVVNEPCTTRFSDIASTIRATIYKQGTRNLMKNVKDGGGYEGVIEPPLRIRKLTPKECFRLMGFADSDIDVLVDNGMSNTQLYKMAGNSIVVDVLEEIFVELLNQYNEVV